MPGIVLFNQAQKSAWETEVTRLGHVYDAPDLERGESGSALRLHRQDKLKTLTANIAAVTLFLEQLDHSPELLYQALYASLQHTLEDFELSHPARQSAAERAFFYSINRKLTCIHASTPLSGSPALARDWRQKYALLCGFIGELDELLVFVDSTEDGIRDFSFAAVLPTIHMTCDDDLPDHLALGKSCGAVYGAFSAAYPDAMGAIALNEFAALEEEDYTVALSQLANAEEGRLQHMGLATQIARAIETQIETDSDPDYKFHTLLLRHTFACLQINPDPAARKKLERLAVHAEGDGSVAKMVLGALFTVIAAINTLVTIATFGVDPLRLNVSQSASAKGMSVTTNVVSGLLAAGFFCFGRRRGLSKDLMSATTTQSIAPLAEPAPSAFAYRRLSQE